MTIHIKVRYFSRAFYNKKDAMAGICCKDLIISIITAAIIIIIIPFVIFSFFPGDSPYICTIYICVWLRAGDKDGICIYLMHRPPAAANMKPHACIRIIHYKIYFYTVYVYIYKRYIFILLQNFYIFCNKWLL